MLLLTMNSSKMLKRTHTEASINKKESVALVNPVASNSLSGGNANR